MIEKKRILIFNKKIQNLYNKIIKSSKKKYKIKKKILND